MAATPEFLSDVAVLKAKLAPIPRDWEGKASVLTLKAANYNWKQMEWWAFYFEHLCHKALVPEFRIPGERFGTVRFDAARSVNWDLKSKAIKSDQHNAILNDRSAMDASIRRLGEHGVVMALCDVDYNDVNRTFQKWHTALKGGLSKFEKDRRERTDVSRYRKTRAILTEILFLRIDAVTVSRLATMWQGRNSNGKPRPPKYMIDLEEVDRFLVDRLRFSTRRTIVTQVAERP
jgi:hypothetical protein